VAALQADIDGLEPELAKMRAEMAKYLKELGFTRGGRRDSAGRCAVAKVMRAFVRNGRIEVDAPPG
jgi:hypothetical protein